MTTVNIAKILSYVNSYHSWLGSDCGDSKEVQRAIIYSERQCKKICGYYPSELPSETEALIEFLKQQNP